MVIPRVSMSNGEYTCWCCDLTKEWRLHLCRTWLHQAPRAPWAWSNCVFLMWKNQILLAAEEYRTQYFTFQTWTLMWIQDWSASSVNPKFFEHEALNQLGHELLNLSHEVYKHLSCDKSLTVQLDHVILQVDLGMVGIMWGWWFCKCVAQLPHMEGGDLTKSSHMRWDDHLHRSLGRPPGQNGG